MRTTGQAEAACSAPPVKAFTCSPQSFFQDGTPETPVNQLTLHNGQLLFSTRCGIDLRLAPGAEKPTTVAHEQLINQ